MKHGLGLYFISRRVVFISDDREYLLFSSLYLFFAQLSKGLHMNSVQKGEYNALNKLYDSLFLLTNYTKKNVF